jgi:hypothetical protein
MVGLGQPATENPFHTNGRKVHSLKTSHIHTPHARVSPRASKRENAAGGAEVVRRLVRVKFVAGHLRQWRQEAQPVFGYSVYESSAPAADRTITLADVIDVRLHLEPYAATMAAA